MKRHLFCIWSEGIKGVYRRSGNVIVEITICFISLIFFRYRICIWVCTIATAIYITIDSGMDTNGIAAIYSTCYVVTTIYVIYMSTIYQHTSRQFTGEIISFQVRTWYIFVVYRRLHVCHTATAIEIIDDKGGVIFDFKEQALWRCHVTTVTTAVEVTHLTSEQVPCRTDRHLSLVVSAKETAYLIGATTWLREGGIDTHLFETGCRQQVGITLRHHTFRLFCGFRSLIGRICISITLIAIGIHQNMVHHRTWVVDVDNILLLHSSIVTTAITIYNRAALDFEVCLILFRELETYLTRVGNNLCNRVLMRLVAPVIDSMCHLAFSWAWCLFVVKVTITTTKELSDIYFLGIRVWLHVYSCCLTVSRILRVCC